MIQLRKSKTFARGVAFAMAAALTVSSCMFGTESAAKAKKKVTKVKINTGKTLVLKKGQSKKLSVTVSPKGASKKVTYKSSNKKVAKVNKKGVVKAVGKKGTAKIKVTSKANKKKSAVIKVKIGTPVKSVKLTGTKQRQEYYYKTVVNQDKESPNYGKEYEKQYIRWVNKGKVFSNKSSASIKMEAVMDKIDLAASFSPKKPTIKKIKYKSSKPSVADVVNNTIVAKKEGNATITATAQDGSGKKATVKITVTKLGNYATPKPTVEGPSEDSLVKVEDFEGKTADSAWEKYTAAGRDIQKDGDILKVVKDPENDKNQCLKVTPQGYDLAPVFSMDLPDGTKLSDYQGISCKVRVVAGPTSDYTYKQVTAYFAKKGTLDYRYAFGTNEDTYNSKSDEEKPYFEFWSDHTMALGNNVLTDDKGGSLHQMPTVTSQGESIGFKYYEEDPAVGFADRNLEFTRYLTDDLKAMTSFDLALGASYKKPASDSEDDTVTWYIDDICLVKKSAEKVNVTSIEVSGQDTVTVGTSAEYTATVAPDNATEKNVTWSVDDETKATIDAATGALTGVAAGEVTITATAKDESGVKGTKKVTIKEAAVAEGDYEVDVMKAASFSGDVGPAALTKNADGDYESPAIDNNAKYFIDLGQTMDLSAYTSMQFVFKSAGGLEFAVWAEDFDPTADQWWNSAKCRGYSSDSGTAEDHDDGSEFKTQEVKLSGDVSAIKYLSIGANKGFTQGQFVIKSIKFLAPQAGVKDILDEYEIIYPVDEKFTDAESPVLGWSNWDKDNSDYAELKDKGVTFVAAAGEEEAYAVVPANEWDGIALPLDNRAGAEAKDFYVEATVRSDSDAVVQVGFSGSNTVADSGKYPGAEMKQYGNDYYEQKSVDAKWYTIKAKISVPKGKFGETRLKGTKETGFFVKNVKIEEYTNQDLTMGEEPKVEEVTGTFTVDLSKPTGEGPDSVYDETTKTITSKDAIGLTLPKEVAAGKKVKFTLKVKNNATAAQDVRCFLTNGQAGGNGDIGGPVSVAAGAEDTITFEVAPATATNTVLFKGPAGGKLVDFTVSEVTVEY